MATITGYTATRMQAIEDGTITSGLYDASGHLILTRHDGTQLDAGLPASATTAQAGIVELATSAETQAGTDTTRAVTPAGLASIPGAKVQTLSGKSESDLPATYPLGISIMRVDAVGGWSLNGGYGTIVTNNVDGNRIEQTFYSNSGGSGIPRSWIRTSDPTDNGGGWTSWQQIVIMATLTPGSFSQTTGLSSYPQGQSRLYYTSANSTSWDFSGNAGEVVTYRDGTDFARQTYTQHVGGTATPAVWTRTANSASGWSKWAVLAQDSGWVNLTITGTGYTQKRQMALRLKNGVVYFKGAATVPSGGYTMMLVIPSAYKPAEDKSIPVTVNTTVQMSGAIDQATGNLSTWASGSTTAWFTLDSFNYPLG